MQTPDDALKRWVKVIDQDRCIGCQACIAACPHDAIFINPEDNSAEKCNLCAHRLEIGLEPGAPAGSCGTRDRKVIPGPRGLRPGMTPVSFGDPWFLTAERGGFPARLAAGWPG